MSFFKKKDNSVILSVYVVPKSSKTKVSGLYGESLKIKLKAPPVDNAANEKLIAFLSNVLKVPKRNIEIISGQTTKRKTVLVKNINIELIEQIVLK